MAQTAKQNIQYTFKYNTAMGRHGWLRLTPAYSVKIVDYILSELKYMPNCILDPFSGTGTTALVCANIGIKSIAYDINPFLVWLAETKTRIYDMDTSQNFMDACHDVLWKIDEEIPWEYPAIYNIERWWGKKQLEFLAKLKKRIWSLKHNDVQDLLKVAFCRELMALSNAAFNHVSTSFKNSTDDLDFQTSVGKNSFYAICEMISQSLCLQPAVTPTISIQDSVQIKNTDMQAFDTLISSPPYPNRISYIRELRPYMYWLDYLKTSNDASDLDWKTIGGTWGCATSKLAMWDQKSDLIPPYLTEIANKIAAAENKSAKLMANYVLKYFSDIALHMQSSYRAIRPGGSVNYIVGNSSFYNILVPSEKLYADILSTIGFSNVRCEMIRKRNCNKALYEYWISARK